MLKLLEAAIAEAIINEVVSPEDESIKEAITEWKLIKRKLAVIEKIGKALSTRIDSLEEKFDEVIADVDGNKAVVDGAILEYVKKKSNTTVKYKEVVDYSLKMVNEAQKKVIEMFIASVTKQGTITDVLAVTDPELEKYLLELKDVTGDELMDKIEVMARAGFDRIPKQVSNAKKRAVKEGVVKDIATLIKHAASGFRTMFSKFFTAMKASQKATDSFVKAVKTEAIKEGKMHAADGTSVTLDNGREFSLKREIRSDKLEAGMIVLATAGKNRGLYEVKGFTGKEADAKTVKTEFSSIAKVFAACKVKTIRDLSEIAGAPRLVVKDLEDGSTGSWFQPAKNGGWVRGASETKASFTLVEEVK